MSRFAPRSEAPSTPPRRLRSIAVGTIAALGLSLLGTMPAAALTVADIAEDPAAWATSPYSPLQPEEIAAPGNSLTLEFDEESGGLPASGDVGTGFTMVQPSSADSQWYLPNNLTVADGSLKIAASKGIAYLHNAPTINNGGTRNQQDNTLGAGLLASGKNLRLTTTLTAPSRVYNSAQAGLWFGPNDDNYLKLVMAAPGSSAGASNRQIQLGREVAAISTSTAVDQVNFDTSTAVIPNGSAVTLILDIDAITGTATAHYQLAGGAVTTLGRVQIPANFLDGSLLTGPATSTVDSFGGVFATKRNMPEATAATFSFNSFTVGETDSTPPAPATNVLGEAVPGQIDVGWEASAAEDLAGYRVYRGLTSPVSTSGTPLSGTDLLTDSSYSDTSTFTGTGYVYSVVAVDASGNAAAAAESTALTTPAPTGTLVEKFNFSTTAGPAVDGYTKDTGLPFAAGTGYGWLTADDGTPFDFSLNARVRTNSGVTTDPRLASVVHMQYGDIAAANAANGITTEEGVWEYNLPNGSYNVVAAMGDSATGNYDSTHALRAEGVELLAPFVGSASNEYNESVATVSVTDGKLTIDAEGGTNGKIAYLEIYEVTAFAPSAPTDVTTTLSSDSVALSWQAVDGAVGYNVYRGASTEVDITGTPLNAETLTATGYSDASVIAGSSYYYVVVALGENTAASAASTAVRVDIPAAPAAPEAPANVVGSLDDADLAVISWDAVPETAGYNIYRGTTATVATDGVALNGAAPLAALTFTDQTVTAGTTYYYIVQSVGNNALVSEASTAIEVAVPEEVVVPGACLSTRWSVDYFKGTALAGAPLVSDCAIEIDQT
ncbi:hypothetical protein, partial [Cryobacterium sp. Y82]|uniref:hypothetical protein n=1 Tax=Cryobacterium sp. Y82 TaxID=2045017 RepID=UPI0018ED5962